MSGCFECEVDHHLACPFLGEDDDGFEADENGWYAVHCCCGLAVDSRQTHEAEYADYAEELRRRGWSQPDSGQHPGGERLMNSELLVCWIDPDYDRTNASDGVSRYGAYVRDYARLFDPWQDGPDGVTRDPVEFTMAAFRVATSPIMSPGYVRWHPRVCGYGTDRSEHDGRLVASITLATPAPLRLPGWSWRGWERDFHDRFLEPEDRGPVALARLELRWPLPGDQLHRPAQPRVPGRPNLVDATAAVAAVVGSVNHTAGPVLAALEAGG